MITKTIGLLKTTVTYEQNLKNLAKANKDELRFTLGYLLGVDTDDTRVNKYKVEGCRQAIMITLLRLMPKTCG